MKNAFKGLISILDTTEKIFSDIEEREREHRRSIYIHFYLYMLQYGISISDPEMI